MNKALSVIQTIEIKADPAVVWDTIINPEKIKLYLFGTEAISDWKTGSAIIFQGEYQGQEYRDKGNILEIQENELLEYSYWSGFSGLEDIPENYSNVRIELEANGSNTMLTISQIGFADEQSRNHGEFSWKGIVAKMKEISED